MKFIVFGYNLQCKPDTVVMVSGGNKVAIWSSRGDNTNEDLMYQICSFIRDEGDPDETIFTATQSDYNYLKKYLAFFLPELRIVLTRMYESRILYQKHEANEYFHGWKRLKNKISIICMKEHCLYCKAFHLQYLVCEDMEKDVRDITTKLTSLSIK